MQPVASIQGYFQVLDLTPQPARQRVATFLPYASEEAIVTKASQTRTRIFVVMWATQFIANGCK